MQINSCCPVYVGHTCWAGSKSAERTTNTQVLLYHWENNFLIALRYFPLPLAHTGGLLFVKGIGVSCVCLKLFFIKVFLLTYSPPSV